MVQTTYDTGHLSQLVATHVNAIFAYWDKAEVCRFANASYKEWLGKSPEEMVEKMTIEQVLGTDLYKRQQPFIKRVLNGEKQSFEREFKLPSGEMRQAFVTYYPDIVNNDVKGFVIHGVDITAVKTVEARILAQEKARNNELLQSIVHAQEAERESLAAQLRDNISQTLYYCKIMLESHNKESNKHASDKLLFEVFDQISGAVNELVNISSGLSSSVVLHFGLMAALEDQISNFSKRFKGSVHLDCTWNGIESISDKQKTSIFRIIQNFLLLITPLTSCSSVAVYIGKEDSNKHIKLQLKYATEGEKINIHSREFAEIENRIAINNGTLLELEENGLIQFSIRLEILE